MDDNLYPRSGAHLLREPTEQQQERNKEAAQVKSALPILEDIITRLDERIAFYDSIAAIPSEVVVKPEEFMHVVAANKLTVTNLQVEKTYLEELIRAHK